MAGNKYIKNNLGVLTEESAIQTSTGAADAGKIPALNAAGKFDESLMPPGIGADTAAIVASENIAAGDLVNIWNDAGTPKIRKADATTAGKQAHGFVAAAVTAPAAGSVYFEGSNDNVTGMTAGNVFLSTTAGLATGTPPSAAGNVVQPVGVATSATSINFEAGRLLVLA